MPDTDQFLVLLKAGVVGSSVACLLSTPLDVLRHSAQASIAQGRAAPGALEAFKAARQAGVRGLWSGLLPALGRAALAPPVFLLVYQQQKGDKTPMEAGLIARGVQATLLQPLEFLRVCRQAGAIHPMAHLRRSPWAILVEDNFWSYWRAVAPTVGRDVAMVAVLWASYMSLQRAVLTEDERESGLGGVRLAGCASASAALAAVVTQPLDVVKTRMQVHQLVRSNKDGYKKVQVARFFKTFRATHAAVGIAGLWTGGLARTLSAAGCGLLLGPLCEYCQVIVDDQRRPFRKVYIIPDDGTGTIVHPHATRTMHIDVK